MISSSYCVTSTNPGTMCRLGDQHITAAFVQRAIGRGQERPAEDLATMQARGDTFVLAVGGEHEIDWPSVTFVSCRCGHGFTMEQGPSAADMIRYAQSHP
jgi:arginase family enzyme